MGTELIRHHVKEESMEISSIPPGFESLTAFSLKRVDDSEVASSSSAPMSASGSQTAKKEPRLGYIEDEGVNRSIKRRPWIDHSQINSSSGDESDSLQNRTSSAQLPKGVVRGCEDCSTCQKVIARWHPGEARMPDLFEAPVFHPTEEEFEDTLKYIASIRDEAEPYGICRIIPPPSWKPPCPLKEKTAWESSTFATRIQRIDKLQNRDSLRKLLRPNYHKKRKQRRCMKSGSDNAGPVELIVSEDGFGFEPGPRVTLKDFQRYADDFKNQYFRKNISTTDAGGNSILHDKWEPSVEMIEGEYWRMVEKPTEEIEVLYGADLETGSFGSGFPRQPNQVASASDEKYVRSGWNLNNLPRIPGSVLSYESSDISGVLVPWLYIGMCFSSFCWHVEDHHLYSMNYMHWGASKLWYGVPGKDAIKLEAAMRKHLPDLFAEQPDLLHKLVTQLSPTILKSEGVPVFRCVQNPGEFVLTFPRAYHSGFNCGFNCAEAVNVAPVDWLPHGQNAIELYREQGRKTSVSHDKLLLGAARDAAKAHWELNLLRRNTPNNLKWKDVCGKDGILSKALKARVEMERMRRDFHCKSSQALKMEATFDANSERECSVCYFDLHLSAAGCHRCSPSKYSCLNHAKQFCSCSSAAKFFLFRHDINDLSIMVEALEGKLSAIYRWVKLDLGLALTSYVSKDDNSPSKKELPSLSPEKPSVIKPSLMVNDNVILISDDEGEISTATVSEMDSTSACDGEAQGDDARGSHPENISCHGVFSKDANPEKSHDLSSTKETGRFNGENPSGPLQETPQCGSGMQKNEERQKTNALDLNSRSTDNARIASGNPSCIQNSLDRYYRQKGPRVAKVVRRINCNVEPLEFGAVQSGHSWCDNRAIYPRGFRSRVKYINVSDPTDMCYYISEIRDGGQDRPLFVVSLEKCQNEVFIHLSAAKSWEMVRERVNHEISKQHKLGRLKLPPLQPPGSLDGMEMFGFSSPSILQRIQSMDRHRLCKEYWESRPFHSQSHNDDQNSSVKFQEPNHPDSVMASLFKKASLDELNILQSVLVNGDSTANRARVARLLTEEMRKRSR
ncbi:putative lysine-specific demethylase JMJ16 isoform X1 [Cynara cardunculus var. scolymus]|uniref:putative lysine-specific demethylase JMJ16 isoform X1 n=1 Tax=Cynara cardunculus var. scolymus TaxID=59895 RepID=UPI000D628349|nr:putative lysine-specific demethylase JMJ16 isoform X1 [Cynara cardunculus var. scolymus]XP_024990791.1 putative lysine-specific demethylase JMJ16 isoform X1 [Cynara cardunculus var. scolymus]XP_024990792.1 putative lysine-specific demethylase JMJ16 isoform X1 [Cynara cardunculus var. scolymus]